MTLIELEEYLKELHREKELKLSIPQGEGISQNPLQKSVCDAIENSRNYNLSNLLIYIKALGFSLSINDVEVNSLSELGAALSSIRQSLRISQADITFNTKLSATRLISLEKGRGSQRKTLEAYLSALSSNINFKLIDKYGLLKESY